MRRWFPVVVLLASGALVASLWTRRTEEPERAAAHDAAPASTPTATPPGTPVPEHAAGAAPAALAAAAFVDESGCAACHAKQAAAWRGTDHDLAMQEARPDTVLGDFSGVHYRDDSNDVLFTRDERGYRVEAEGPDGARASFDVPYVFGVDPLQQVLLPGPRGRLQALSVAWDVHAKRWYTLNPGDHIDWRDPLHWTRAPYNWNFSCAECHATGLLRGYDVASDTYATTWKRLDVGCQACHGPAEKHLAWALGDESGAGSGRGFDAPLGASGTSTREVEACARCHARRSPLGDGFDHRNRFLDDYLPALLTAGLYHADGQLLDEVYEYGSFLQSKMHARGLRCSDCHDPHSLRLVREGNNLCTGCHSPTPAARAHVDVSTLVRKNYDSSEHHHHAPGTPGSQCVDCHMTSRTYMGVDERRDHGFRVPRPDLASLTGAPDACTGCHAGKDAAWAAGEIARWTGKKEPPAHFGVALQAARTGRKGAADALLALAASDEPPIVRATALGELRRYPSRAALEAFVRGLGDRDGLVRIAALGGLELLPPAERAPLAAPLAADPLRAVRTEAASLVMDVDPATLGAQAEAMRKATAEFADIQRGLADRPEGHLNLARLLVAQEKSAEAERELRTGLRIDPLHVQCIVNLADLVRSTKGEAEAEGVLRDGLGRVPDAAPLHHALALSLVRQKRTSEGLSALARAAELAPEDTTIGYVHAVALYDLGSKDAARAELERVLARDPGARDVRLLLVEYLRMDGHADEAQRRLAELAAINPHDPALANAVAPRTPGR